MTAAGVRFDVEAERRKLGAMTAGELRRRYQEIGGDEARSRNREYLIRRILWMLQAGERGGSKRAAFERRTFAESCDLGVLLDRVGPGRIVRPPLPEVHHMEFTIEFEREADGRWIAEIPSLPSTMAYGATPEQARAHVQALALRVVAERLEHEEAGSEALTITFRAA